MNDQKADIIDRMLRGDPSSFDDVLALYADDVLRLAFWLMKDYEEAEDVLQESMISLVGLVRKGKYRRANGSIKGFLLRCARNNCINRLKRKRKSTGLCEINESEYASLQETDTPDKALDRSRLYSEFEKALFNIPDIQRTILVLYEYNGESYKDIAKILNVSVEYVRKNLYLARKEIENILAPFRGLL
jgi:RNA polymerase sigma factor (sigma-70 family)